MPQTIEDLGKLVKTKYPGAYNDIPDVTLGQKVKAKYPTAYGDFTDMPAAPQKSFIQKASEFVPNLAIGAGRGVLSSIRGYSSLGERGLQLLTGQDRTKPTAAEQLIPKSATTATNFAQKLGKGAEQIAEFFIPGGASEEAAMAAEKVVGAGTKLGKLAGIGAKAATEAGLFAGQTALQRGKIDKTVGEAAAFGAAFPIAGAALGAGAKAIKANTPEWAGKVINTLIQPLKKDFSFGKNPGMAVAKEGIVANSLDELATKIDASQKMIGQKLATTISSLPTDLKLSLKTALSPLDAAMEKAAKQNDQALVSRLAEAKQAIENKLSTIRLPDGTVKIVSGGARDLTNMTPQEAIDLKREIGSMTKWTGNITSDVSTNKALRQVYGTIKETINKAVDSVDPVLGKQMRDLNERYANLQSASVATKYRDVINQRKDLISILPKLSIGGGLIIGITTGHIAPALEGLGAAAIEKLASSPAVKTRLAAWLAGASAAEKASLFEKLPALKTAFERVFGKKTVEEEASAVKSPLGKFAPKVEGATAVAPKAPEVAATAEIAPKTAPEMTVSDLASGGKAQVSQPKITDLAKFDVAKGLSAADRKIETAGFKHILKNEDSILEKYRAEKDTENGKIVSTDSFRKYIPGYNGSNSAAVQEPASYLAKRARAEALKNPEKFSTIYAGGSGTGKSSAVKSIPELKYTMDNSALVLDGNLSTMSSANKIIAESKAAGKKPVLVYVYREPMDSFENGVVYRMKNNLAEMGRLVPTKVVAENHIGSWDVINQLKDDYVVTFIDNSLGKDKAQIVSFGDLNKKISYPSKEQLTKLLSDKAKQLKADGMITLEQLQGYLK